MTEEVNNSSNPTPTTPLNEPVVVGGTPANFSDVLDKHRHENGKILGKFDAPDKLAEAYLSLEKESTKTRQEMKKLERKAPESYDLSLDESLKDRWQIDENDPRLARFLPKFKELNLQTNEVKALINTWVEAELEDYDKSAEEFKALAAENPQLVKDLFSFAEGLPEAEQEAYKSMVQTPEQAKVLHRILSAARQGGNIPATPKGTSSSGKSKQQLMDDAFAYQKANMASISSNKGQQEEFFRLLNLASKAS